MTNKTDLIKEAGIDLAVLGNVKGWKWYNTQSNPKPAVTSSEFRAASEKSTNRKSEAVKAKTLINNKQITISDLMNAVKGAEGKVAYAQLQDWLGLKEEKRASKQSEKSSDINSSTTTINEDVTYTISKAERYFFDALLLMVQVSDIEEAKRLVFNRLLEEEKEEIERKAQEAMKTLNLDNWLSATTGSGNNEGSDSRA
ncbi:hypothetical protein QUQ16_000175 [Escherichia coli]|nr:hypothetical protein [Escherichia coli]